MNILYLNHYAGSPSHGMEFRPYYLAREWVRAGHHVTMVAATYSHLRARQPAPGCETIDGIDYRWVAAPRYQGNGVGRVRNIAVFLAAVWRQAAALVREVAPQVVIASSTYPMDIWVARRIARLARARLVYEVHDLWPLTPRELYGMPRWHPFVMLCQWAEDTGYRDADLVVSMLPKVHEYMASRGLDLARLVIVPNGITLEEWLGEPEPLAPGALAALDSARGSGSLVVGYAGSHGAANALDTLLDAARELRGEAFRFVLVGDGHERARLAERVRAEGLDTVRMLPPIPKAQIPSFLGAVDIAYIGWQRMPLYRFGIAPNKLMDYMMAGCPVLHAVEAGNDPVAEAGCGLTVAPESATEVARGLRRLAAMPPEQLREIGERGRAFVLRHHTYPVLAERFLRAMEVPA
jgi:glycosyltransferase involved in cell wall biosynthesis